MPADLAAVVRCDLSKDPAERYADGQAIAAALRDPATAAMAIAPVRAVAPATQAIPAVTPAPTGAVPVQDDRTGDRSRAWMWALIGAIAAALAVILALWLINRDSGDETPGDETSQSPTPVGVGVLRRANRPPARPPSPPRSSSTATTTSAARWVTSSGSSAPSA